MPVKHAARLGIFLAFVGSVMAGPSEGPSALGASSAKASGKSASEHTTAGRAKERERIKARLAAKVKKQETPSISSEEAESYDGSIVIDDQDSVAGCSRCESNSDSNYFACGSCDPCSSRFWFRAESLLWWQRGADVPTLVTSGPVNSSIADAGRLGNPATTTLFGNSKILDGSLFGGRFTMGVLTPRELWRSDSRPRALEADFFILENEHDSFFDSSRGDPILARPFFDPTISNHNALLVAFPRLSSGFAQVNAVSGTLGTGVFLRENLCCYTQPHPCCGVMDACCDPCSRNGYQVDMIAGYRYLQVVDRLAIFDAFTIAGAGGSSFEQRDYFGARNRFHGLDFGFSGQYFRGRWTMGAGARLAMGATHEVVSIDGATKITTAGGATILPGGLLAQPTNMGNHVRSVFSFLPQIELSLGYRFSPGLKIFGGYNFMYLTNVARVGNQIDRGVNPTQIPPGALVGTPRPGFRFDGTDFWLNGISMGLEARY